MKVIKTILCFINSKCTTLHLKQKNKQNKTTKKNKKQKTNNNNWQNKNIFKKIKKLKKTREEEVTWSPACVCFAIRVSCIFYFYYLISKILKCMRKKVTLKFDNNVENT